MSSLRFSVLLKLAMDEYGVGPTKLGEILRERGIENIHYKRISEYIRGISTPSLEKARILMDTLEYPVSDAMLKESLEVNRDLIREEKELVDQSGYNRVLNVHVRLRNVYPGHNSLENETRVYDRIMRLYGEYNLSTYIEQLIAEDLQHDILKGVKSDEN